MVQGCISGVGLVNYSKGSFQFVKIFGERYSEYFLYLVLVFFFRLKVLLYF